MQTKVVSLMTVLDMENFPKKGDKSLEMLFKINFLFGENFKSTEKLQR
jgi:hypothetical protein